MTSSLTRTNIDPCLIRVTNLTVDYGKQAVVNRLSFVLDPTTSPLILVGPNGSGKSTLIRALMGLHPYQGEISPLPGTSKVAWFPQQFPVTFKMPVADFVAMGAIEGSRFFPSYSRRSIQLANGLLEDWGIGYLKDRFTDGLSGGEWQLVCLAQLHLQDASVWLLDEPTASLDIGFKGVVFQKIWEESRKGRLILMSTHDVPFLPASGGTLLLLDQEFPSRANSRDSQDWVVQKIQEKYKRPGEDSESF
jgi:ABC-type Mn2+/Zn2+ transport system ATPase subunit